MESAGEVNSGREITFWTLNRRSRARSNSGAPSLAGVISTPKGQHAGWEGWPLPAEQRRTPAPPPQGHAPFTDTRGLSETPQSVHSPLRDPQT